MSKSQIQNNPNIMVFSGDNINIPMNPIISSQQNMNAITNSITSSLEKNVNLNGYFPNLEKRDIKNSNIKNNLRDTYLSNINVGNLPIAGLRIQNLNGNSNQTPIEIPLNQSLNIDLKKNGLMIENNYENLGNKNIIDNIDPKIRLETISSLLNSNMLPQPIPFQLDKKMNLGLVPPVINSSTIGKNFELSIIF